MQFGIFYEHQLPRPWTEGAELKLFQEALDQVELADKLGALNLRMDGLKLRRFLHAIGERTDGPTYRREGVAPA
jgi:hypothetical protein